jgi:threonine/homoserine/homoserine lactone efflux protein
MLSAWLTGLLMGLAGSMPIAGPTSMLVLSFGLHGRVRAAAWLALGSALPEGLWAGLALWGFAALVESYEWVEAAAEIGASLILIAVGLLLVLRPPKATTEGDEAEASSTSDARTFLLGLSLTGLNPTLIFNWGAAVALAVSLGAVAPSHHMAIPFGLGVVSGIVAWFSFALVLLERHHRRISLVVRSRIMRIMGLSLLVLGSVAAIRLLYLDA